MRRSILLASLAAACLLLAACITINVYFPEAAAEQAAGRFVEQVIGAQPQPAQPAAPAAEKPTEPPAGHAPSALILDVLVPSAQAQEANLRVQTPQVQAIRARMEQRFAATLAKYLDGGAIGFTSDGLVAMRDATAIPLPERAAANAAIADENRDREAVYREIAVANGHPEWTAQIRAAFARQWIEQARAGWYWKDAAGAWQKK